MSSDEKFLDKTWLLYEHKCLTSGKSYFGITSQGGWKKRSGKNGINYKNQYCMKQATNKYDWDNEWEHIILHDNLTRFDASKLEFETIKNKLKDKIYNISQGNDNFFAFVPFDLNKPNEISCNAPRRFIAWCFLNFNFCNEFERTDDIERFSCELNNNKFNMLTLYINHTKKLIKVIIIYFKETCDTNHSEYKNMFKNPEKYHEYIYEIKDIGIFPLDKNSDYYDEEKIISKFLK